MRTSCASNIADLPLLQSLTLGQCGNSQGDKVFVFVCMKSRAARAVRREQAKVLTCCLLYNDRLEWPLHSY